MNFYDSQAFNEKLNEPQDEDYIEKIYWTISEVGDLLGIVPSHIRHIEASFKLSGHRNKKGDRRYTRDEIEQLKVVYGLTLYLHFSVVRDMIANQVHLDACLKELQKWVYWPSSSKKFEGKKVDSE